MFYRENNSYLPHSAVTNNIKARKIKDFYIVVAGEIKNKSQNDLNPMYRYSTL